MCGTALNRGEYITCGECDEKFSRNVEKEKEKEKEINTSSSGYKISGIQKLQGGIIKTEEDHRIAMTGVVANICINSEIKIDNIDCISDSYPSFFSDLEKIGAEYVS